MLPIWVGNKGRESGMEVSFVTQTKEGISSTSPGRSFSPYSLMFKQLWMPVDIGSTLKFIETLYRTSRESSKGNGQANCHKVCFYFTIKQSRTQPMQQRTLCTPSIGRCWVILFTVRIFHFATTTSLAL